VNFLSADVYLKRGSCCISLDLGLTGPAVALNEAAVLAAEGVETRWTGTDS